MARKTKKTATAAGTNVARDDIIEAPPEPANPTPPSIGRRSKYRAEFCDVVRQLGNEGKSKVQMARSLGVGRDTMNNWATANPEFAEALSDAVSFSQAWWEDLGQKGAQTGIKGDFNAMAYTFQMKNRFRSDYQDSQKQELELGTGFLKFLDAARKGEFKTPAPAYPKAA
jgi:hypothetical protein